MEKWKPIYMYGKDTNYIVSSYGRIGNLNTGKIQTQYNRAGYPSITMYIDGKQYNETVHVLVAVAFIENPDGKPEINHKDGNKMNPHVDNLEYCTESENAIHAFKLGLRSNKSGIDSHLNKYSEKLVISICEMIRDGFSNTEISNTLDTTDSYVDTIRSRRKWKHISEKYIFPKLQFNYSKKYDTALRLRINELVKVNRSNPEICDILGITNTKSVQDLIYRIRKSEERSTTIPRT